MVQSSGCDAPTGVFSLGAFAPNAPKKSAPMGVMSGMLVLNEMISRT